MTERHDSIDISRDELARRLRALAETRRAIVVGVGNVGSRLAMELPLVGVKELVFIDHDFVSERNTLCCSVIGSSADVGQRKVEVLADRVRARFPDTEVATFATPLNNVGLARLRDVTPAVLVGAVDSRRARYDLAQAAMQLDVPLVDLAIAHTPDDIQTRVQVTWTGVRRVNPLAAWTARDWHLIEQVQPCAAVRRESEDDRPVASSISGALAAALGATEVGRLLAGDISNLGYEIQVSLTRPVLIRCALPSSGLSPLSPGPAGERGKAEAKSRRRAARICQDLHALEALARHDANFSVQQKLPWLLFRYTDTPGLVETQSGLSICTAWTARVFLGPHYPLVSPRVFLAPTQADARPFHPNVLPKPPYAVCRGRYAPTVLLDEMARQIRRIIRLEPTSVMTDENQALDYRACRFVRRLIAEGSAPLHLDVPLPAWCTNPVLTGGGHERL